MKYRTKVLILLLAMSITTNGIALLFIYSKFKGILFEQVRSQVLSIAATTSSLINGDIHKDIKGPQDESSRAYVELQNLLRRSRDANRRDDVYIKYMYTLTQSSKDDRIIKFGVDAEENPKDKSTAGEIYRGEFGNPFKIDAYQVDPHFIQDQWGIWLSANAPIKDSSGKVIAALGVDMAAKEVVKKVNDVFIIILSVFASAVVITLVVAFFISKQASKPLYALKKTLDEIGKGNLDAQIEIKTKDEFGTVALAVQSMTKGLQERERLKFALSRYVSQPMLDSVIMSGNMPSLKGERRRITVLFSDIRGFSSMSEGMPPEQVVELLNEYFERMIEIIFRNHGTLDKFLGDGIMAIFGAPFDDPNHEEHAVRAALEMQQELQNLCQKWQTEGRHPIRAGIGINSGIAIVGNIGSSRRMEYTVIGDTVNLAANLEPVTKDLGVDILISEYTLNAVRGIFKVKHMGAVHVKGRHEPINTYTVEGAMGTVH